MASESPTLLLGMGNPILTDDAVGIRLARDMAPVLGRRRGLDVVADCSVGGLNLLDLICGYRRLIVLDAMRTPQGRPGDWERFDATALRNTLHLSCIHDVNFATALALGRELGLALPEDANIHILAVEIEDDRTFGTKLSPLLDRAYPRLRQEIQAAVSEILDLATSTSSPTRRPCAGSGSDNRG